MARGGIPSLSLSSSIHKMRETCLGAKPHKQLFAIQMKHTEIIFTSPYIAPDSTPGSRDASLKNDRPQRSQKNVEPLPFIQYLYASAKQALCEPYTNRHLHAISAGGGNEKYELIKRGNHSKPG